MRIFENPEPSKRTVLANLLYEEAKLQPDEVNYRLDEYRAEVLREVAEGIRENFAYCEDPNGSGTCCGVTNVLRFIHSEEER